MAAAGIMGMTADELSRKSGATVIAINELAQRSPNIAVIKGQLIHTDAFVDWDEGARQLASILDRLMARNNGYVSDAQLYEYARGEMAMFLNDNDMDDARSVYDMAESLFGGAGYDGRRYTFNQKTHISQGESISSKLNIIQKYARDNGGMFDEAALVEELTRLGVNPNGLHQAMLLNEKPIFLYYAPDTFITVESMGIDKAWLERAQSALSRLFGDMGDHVPLRDIAPWWYSLMPPLPGGREWTPLLLQGVVRHYGDALQARTINAMAYQSMDTLHAMIVSADSPLQNFGDVVAATLLDNGIDRRRFAAEELRQLLLSHGLISGGELYNNMPKALPNDGRFAWDAGGQYVTINI